MRSFLRAAALSAFFALICGCTAYPYGAGFSACDNHAGACYRDCERFAGAADYGACHADCDREANRCFDRAYGPYGYAGSPYVSPWYGSYGVWRPGGGYAYSSVTVINPYRYSRPRAYDGDRRDRGRDRDRWRDDGRRNGERWRDGRGERRYDRRRDGGSEGPSEPRGGGRGSGAARPPTGPESGPPPASSPPPAAEPSPHPARRRGQPRGSDDRPPQGRVREYRNRSE